ncbi:MAG: exo-alpha-sialidase [Sphingobacteriales bacterium]|nr:exo-alpha-sialidase [Sphingobacteriales bacterium]
MMKRIFSAMPALCCALSIVWLSSCQQNQVRPPHEATPEGIGSREDAFARRTYELQRLRNPQSGAVPPNMRHRELAFAATLPTAAAKSSEDKVWTKRGPYNIGGRTRAFAFDVQNQENIIAGGVTGGIWKSTDGGASFTQVSNPDQIHSFTAIAQNRRANRQHIWYAGTGEEYGVVSAASFSNVTTGNGIFKSTDNGNSWQLLPATLADTPENTTDGTFDIVWRVVVDHITPLSALEDVVYAAVYNGIMRSTDGGDSWQPVLGFGSGTQSTYTDIIMTPSGVLYAAMSAGNAAKGLYRSTDGTTWTKITPTGFPNLFNRVVLAACPNNENEVFFLVNSGTNNHQLWHYTYVSGDGSGEGGVWNNRTTNLPKGSCLGFYDFDFAPYSSQYGYDMCIAFQPDNCQVVYLGGTNVYRSTDAFTTADHTKWIGGYQCDTETPSNYVYPNHHPDIHYFAFNDKYPNRLYTGSDGGLHYTAAPLADSVQWESLNNGYVTSQFYTVAIEPNLADNDLMIGGMQDNGIYFTNSNDGDFPWSKVFYGDGAYVAIDAGRHNYYLSWQNGKIFKFGIDDYGKVTGFTRIDANKEHLFIQPFVLDPSTFNQLYSFDATSVYVLDSLDAIELDSNEYEPLNKWKKISASTVNSLQQGTISFIAKSTINEDALYYATDRSKVFRLKGISNGVYVKENISSALFPANAYTSCITLDDASVDDILVSFSNYGVKSIFYTYDGGTSWQDVSGNLEENADGSGSGPSVLWVDIHNYFGQKKYYAGTTVGLFSCNILAGANTIWTRESPDLIGTVPVNMIQSRDFDNTVAVATHGRGVFSLEQAGLVGNGNEAAALSGGGAACRLIPNVLHTPQNAQLRLQLNGSETIQVSAWSINGGQVADWGKKTYPSGEHIIPLTMPAALPKGTYLIQISGTGWQKTEKLVRL